MTTIRIPYRFRGPEESGNGGYSAGLLAGSIEGDVQVTLRRPPPIDRDLDIVSTSNGLELRDADLVIAEAVSTTAHVDIPPSPGLAAARRASTGFAGLDSHFFPTCFSCGPGRDDGLGIFAGPLGDRSVAAVFSPDPSLPASDGCLTTPIVWAALDCSGAWAEHRLDADAPIVLGRMAVHVEQPVKSAGEYVVLGWPTGRDGRKLYSATALFDGDGTALAWSEQTWILLG